MQTILFSTGNERKIKEARAGCELFDIAIEQVVYEFDEIQSHDPVQIATHKVEQAYRLASKPIVVTDTSWNIPSLNGFPGGYMKDVAEWFTPEDFINLISPKEDKSLIFRESIIYKDADEVKIFSKEYVGTIADSARGGGNSIEQVAEFDGHTLGERQDQGRSSHDPKDYIWYEFAKWYSEKTAR